MDQWDGYPIYRGEENGSYILHPGYGRLQLLNAWNTPARERQMLEQFKKEAVPHISPIPQNNWNGWPSRNTTGYQHVLSTGRIILWWLSLRHR